MLLSLLLIFAFMLGHISCSTGGQFAYPGQFPYLATVLYNGRQHCGGSLISEFFILTAAHCTIRRNPAFMRIVVGTTDLLAGNGQTLNIAQVFIHPLYNSATQDYDISLIRLAAPVTLGTYNVDKIELAEPDANYAANTMATISGFGAINSKLQLSPRLKFARVPLWSRDYCNPRNIPGITDRMICAGHPSGQISSCEGDSGGPLTVNNKLFGVVSWGFGCGAHGRPSVYTYVGALRSWIRQNSGV